jgi:hypothetical protein
MADWSRFSNISAWRTRIASTKKWRIEQRRQLSLIAAFLARLLAEKPTHPKANAAAGDTRGHHRLKALRPPLPSDFGCTSLAIQLISEKGQCPELFLSHSTQRGGKAQPSRRDHGGGKYLGARSLEISAIDHNITLALMNGPLLRAAAYLRQPMT